MTKREKVILGVTGVVALLAGLQLLLPGSGNSRRVLGSTASAAVPQAVVPVVQVRLQALQLSPAEQRVIERLTLEWPEDPFLEIELQLEQPASVDGPRYMGFLQVGQQRIGWIDGQDYQVGDRTADERFEIKALGPQDAVLQAVGSLEVRTLKLEQEY